VKWLDARVVRAGGEEDRGIRGAVLHVVERRIGVERLELLRILHAPELGRVELPVRRELYAQHVVDPHG
jgi:hypothetical protein